MGLNLDSGRVVFLLAFSSSCFLSPLIALSLTIAVATCFSMFYDLSQGRQKRGIIEILAAASKRRTQTM